MATQQQRRLLLDPFKENPFLALMPLNGTTAFFERVNPAKGTKEWKSSSLNASGALRWKPGLDPLPENPTLTDARLAGTLAMQDRAGAFSATGSGAVRYRVGPGGRVNLLYNTRVAVDLNGWVAYGTATRARVADSDFTGGFAIETDSSITDNGVSMSGVSVVGKLQSKSQHVLSLDAKSMSGATNWRVQFTEFDAAGGTLGGGQVALTPTTQVGRLAVAYTPSTTGVHYVIFRIVRASSTAGVIRFSNMVFEQAASAAPVPAFFDGASGSPAAWLDPITGALGTANASPSTNIAAEWPEEATTNYFPDPMGVNFPGYGSNYNSQGGNPPTATKDTSYGYGPAAQAIKLVAPGSGASEGILIYTPTGLAIAGGGSFAHSVWVRGSGTMQYGCTVIYTDATADASASNTIVLTDVWQKITMPVIASNGAKTVDRTSLYVRTNSAQATTFWLSCWQSEQKAYATSFAAGSLGTGYAWTGSANASASTRTIGRIDAPVAGHFDIQRGSFAGWFMRDYDVGNYQELWDTGVNGGTERLALVIDPSDLLHLHGGGGGVSVTTLLTRPTTITPGTWFFAYCAWDGPNVYLSLNGESPVAGSRGTPFPATAGANFQLGSVANSSSLNGGLFGFQFFDQPLTDADVVRLRNGGTPPANLGFNFLPSTYLKPARVNRGFNTRAAVNTTGWIGVSRVLDSDFDGGTAFEVTNATLNDGAIAAQVYMPIGKPMTISFDLKWMAGQQDKWYVYADFPGVGNTGGLYTIPVGFLDGAKRRVSFFWTANLNQARLNIVRGGSAPSGSSTIRFSNVVMEDGYNLVPTAFDGSSPNAAWLDPLTGYLGTAHASPSVSGVQLLPEEGVTNAVADPIFGNASIAVGWVAGGAATIARDTTFATLGPASGKAICTASTTDGIAGNAGAGTLACLAGDVVTVQAVVRANAAADVGKTVKLCITERSNVGAGLVDNLSPAITLTDSAQEVFFTATMTNGATTQATMKVFNGAAAAVTFNVMAAQLAKKAFPTSICAGSLGTGQSWAGTAHASASTRADCKVSVSPAGRINLAQGEVILRASRLVDAGREQYAFAHWNNTDARIYIYANGAGDDRWNGRAANSGTAASVDATNDVGILKLLSLSWDGANFRSTKNGAISAPVAYSGGMSSLGSEMVIGGHSNPALQLNGPVGPVAIPARELTAAEYEKHRTRPVWEWDMHLKAA